MRRILVCSLLFMGCAHVRPLQTPIAEKGFGLLARLGPPPLRAESGRLEGWARGRAGLRLRRGAVSDRDGARFPLSRELSQALSRMNDYFAMTEATLARPLTRDELRSALLSEAGVAEMRGVYERMIAARIPFPGKLIIPEAGGDATLDRTLRLHELADLGRPLALAIARHASDPAALARACAGDPETLVQVDEQGLLTNLLVKWPVWESRDSPSRAERQAILLKTAGTVVENAARAYRYHPRAQLEAIIAQDWSGRYVGMWHAHPPHYAPEGWQASDEPSPEDREVALAEGQNLTFVFQPDGFDAYDLAPAAGAKITFRSEAWHRRFAALLAACRPS